MSSAPPILQTTLADRRPDRQGKVRDIYDFGERLLIVATDRISAFDYVLGSGIPDKGKVLTQISAFWFERTRAIVANHVLSTDAASFPGEARRSAKLLQGRSMLVARTEPLPIECVARGYLSGSGWKDYVETGKVCGIRLPNGLRESARLPEPIFTPATKAQTATTSTSARRTPPTWSARRPRARPRPTLRLYSEAPPTESAARRRHEVEFGLLPVAEDDHRTVEDRINPHRRRLTPDSSRFWPVDGYRPGGTQPSFDKRSCATIRTSREQRAGPTLPDDVVRRRAKQRRSGS